MSDNPSHRYQAMQDIQQFTQNVQDAGDEYLKRQEEIRRLTPGLDAPTGYGQGGYGQGGYGS